MATLDLRLNKQLNKNIYKMFKKISDENIEHFHKAIEKLQ